jgi:phosphate/sulfate permease
MQGAITHLFAGVPLSDLDAGIDWYTRFFGRPPDARVGDGLGKRLAAVRWGIAGRMATAWVLTLPAAALVAGGVWKAGTR